MANCSCDVKNKRLSPGVFNLKQYLNDTEVMRWTFSSRYCEDNNIDFMNYDAILVLQCGEGRATQGKIDEILLTSKLNDDGTITLAWDVGKYATWLTGRVKYQIVFRGKCLSELSVMMPDTTDPAHGLYAIDNEIVDGYFRTWTHKTNTDYKVQYNSTAGRWELLNGETVVSYQTFPQPDPCCGTWSDCLVGNNTACAWYSHEAVMYISESIAADEYVSAKCPTILRQMWLKIRDMIIKSGVQVVEIDISADDWEEWNGEYRANVTALADIPAGAIFAGGQLWRVYPDGLNNVDNVRFAYYDDLGVVWVYCPERLDARLTAYIRGGNGYVFVAEDDLANIGGGGTGGVSSVNGKAGSVTLNAGDVGAYSKTEADQLLKAHNENKQAHPEKANADDVYSKSDMSLLLAAKLNKPETAGTAGQVLGLVETEDGNVVQWVDQSGGGGAGATDAASITIADSGNYYSGSNVEAALKEAGNSIKANTTTLNDHGKKITALETALSGLENALKGI